MWNDPSSDLRITAAHRRADEESPSFKAHGFSREKVRAVVRALRRFGKPLERCAYILYVYEFSHTALCTVHYTVQRIVQYAVSVQFLLAIRAKSTTDSIVSSMYFLSSQNILII